MYQEEQLLNAEEIYNKAILCFEEYHCFFSKKILEDAIMLFTKAANLGCVKAQSMLGALYISEKYGKKNEEQSVYWHQKAANSGNIKSQAILGFAYYYGCGCSVDYPKAYELFMKVYNVMKDKKTEDADIGPNLWQKWQTGYIEYMLALMCYKGRGITQDHVRGSDFLASATNKGNIAAIQFSYQMLTADEVTTTASEKKHKDDYDKDEDLVKKFFPNIKPIVYKFNTDSSSAKEKTSIIPHTSSFYSESMEHDKQRKRKLGSIMPDM